MEVKFHVKTCWNHKLKNDLTQAEGPLGFPLISCYFKENIDSLGPLPPKVKRRDPVMNPSSIPASGEF